MQYETGLFEKVKCLVKSVKKCFFEKVKCLVSTYKIDDLSSKLSKRTIHIYKGVYFILKSTKS